MLQLWVQWLLATSSNLPMGILLLLPVNPEIGKLGSDDARSLVQRKSIAGVAKRGKYQETEKDGKIWLESLGDFGIHCQ
jgi:hypothetical protein